MQPFKLNGGLHSSVSTEKRVHIPEQFNSLVLNLSAANQRRNGGQESLAATVPLGTLCVLGLVAVAALCGTGVALCREIMLDEVQRRLPEGQKIKYPYLSYKYSQIVRLHAQFYPESRIRAASRFLFGMALVTMGSLMLISFGLVMYRRLTHSGKATRRFTGEM
jgi:hypothetical protein